MKTTRMRHPRLLPTLICRPPAVGVRESWRSVAKPGESGGGEEKWEVGGTATDEGEVKRVGWRLER